ncbi:hypothetical protein MMC27_002908 [Xylographa pallens]|nr:hypothetical protein [Xylographa pallens]
MCANDATKEGLAGLRMEQSSQLVTTTTSAPTIAEHLEDIRCEIRNMAENIANPVIRAGCEQGMVTGLEQTFSTLVSANPLKKSSKSTAARSVSRDQGYRKQRVVLSRTANMLETFFGSIRFHTETTKSYIQGNPTTKSALPEHYEHKTTFRLFPAWWLINMGLDYTINFTFMSNYQGWHQYLESMRAVSGDSLIFCACGEGDLDLVRRLLSTGEASVRDQNPNGVTPLHIAAYFRQPAVCQFLLEHGSDRFALMQTWDNKLLIFGSTAETLTHFCPMDGDIENPQFYEISPSEVNYRNTLVEVLNEEHSLFPFSPGVDWLIENSFLIAKFADNCNHLIDRCPSINSIIARCVNLSPHRSVQDNVYHVETITSLAMRNPSQFQRWQTYVSTEFHVDRQKFLSWEVSKDRLKDDGWTPATLGDLFAQSYICGKASDKLIHCQRCQVCINSGRMVEWEEYVDSIKNGTFVVRKDQTHKIRITTPTLRKTDPRESNTPQYRDKRDSPIMDEEITANRVRRAILSNKPKRFLDELQFWDRGPRYYFHFRLYRTRELYDTYAGTGLCPNCAAAEAGEGLVDETEYQAFKDTEEEPPMLAPF